jgi:hypothetical protein
VLLVALLVALTVALSEGLAEATGVTVALPEALPEGLTPLERLGEEVMLGEGDTVELPRGLRLLLAERLIGALPLLVDEAAGEAEEIGVLEELAELAPEAVAPAEDVAAPVRVKMAELEGVPLVLLEAKGEALRDAVELGDAAPEGEGGGLIEAAPLADAPAVAEMGAEGLGDGVVLPLVVPVKLARVLAEKHTVGDEDMEALAEAPEAGEGAPLIAAGAAA